MLKSFGQRILAARKERGLGQDEVASAVGVHPKTISRWENDKQPADLEHVERLASVLGVSVDWLRHGEPKLPGGRVSEQVAAYRTELPKQLALLAHEFEGEVLRSDVDDDFKRYARARLRDPELLEMYAGGATDIGEMTEEEQFDDYKVLIEELRARLARRLKKLGKTK